MNTNKYKQMMKKHREFYHERHMARHVISQHVLKSLKDFKIRKRKELTSGSQISDQLRSNLKMRISATHTKLCLATILIGQDPASALYVRMKNRACKHVGITTENYHLDKNIPAKQLHDLINKLNNNPKITGILVEKPYQIKGATEQQVDAWIAPDKDVDGTCPKNVAATYNDTIGLRPCTPQGIITLLQYNGVKDWSGKTVAIINRSEIVGKPLAMMLINKGAEVTVINHYVSHIWFRKADFDIIIAATGHANLIKASAISKHSILVPVSEVRTKHGKLHGDFTNKAMQKALISFHSTGNVGPLCITALLENVFRANELQHGQGIDN